MTDNSTLIDTVSQLLHEAPEALGAAGITDELNLRGWLSARNLRGSRRT